MTLRCSSIDTWRAGFGRLMFNLDFEPFSDQPFHASFDQVLDGIPIVRAAFSPGLTIRNNELAKDGDTDFGLVIVQSKRLNAMQRGHEVQLRRGEATLLRVSDPGVVGACEHFWFIAIRVPFAELEARAPGIGNRVARRVPVQSEVLGLIHDYIKSAEKYRLGASAETRDVIHRHLADLIALAVMYDGALGESHFSPVVAARLGSALDHIASRFQDPQLSVDVVARRMGISSRYLQRILETSGISFTERVNELRLQKAFALLIEPRLLPLRISDIALQAGFSDISYFNRLFSSRFGRSPSSARASAAT